MLKLTSRFISDNAILAIHLSAGAKQSVLESKLTAYRQGVANKASGASSSVVVTTEVELSANTDVAVTSLTAAKGIYTGAVSGATDSKKVIIRQAGKDQGVVDDNNDEIYGVLTEAAGVYTLSFFNADGTAFTFASTTDIDFYFVEVRDLFDMPADIHLRHHVSGVVDADQLGTLGGHLDGGANKHDASEIDVEASGNYLTIADLATNLAALDSQISTNAGNISTNAGAISTLQGQIGNVEVSAHEVFTLAAGDITAKFVDLTNIPKNASYVMVQVDGGFMGQRKGIDFDIITDGSDIKRLSWDPAEASITEGMTADLIAGDIVRVWYTY